MDRRLFFSFALSILMLPFSWLKSKDKSWCRRIDFTRIGAGKWLVQIEYNDETADWFETNEKGVRSIFYSDIIWHPKSEVRSLCLEWMT
jgi:hypothetical protein